MRSKMPIIIQKEKYENFVEAKSGTPLTDIFPDGIYFDEARGIIQNCDGVQTSDYPLVNGEPVNYSKPLSIEDILMAKNKVYIEWFFEKQIKL